MTLRLVALFAAITLLLAYPLSFHPATHVVSAAPDTDLFLWTLAWDAHALATRPLDIFDANIYAPQRLTLAYSENLIGSALFAAPVLWITRNPVLAMNLVALLSAVLCGLGAWWLARRVGVSKEGAVVAGLVFAFSPPRFLRLDQIHLVALQWIPFALAAFHGYLGTGRRADLWLTALFFSLQVLSSGHGAVFLSLALLLVFVWHTGLGGGRLDIPRRVRDFGWQGVLLMTPVAASLAPYFAVQREIGLRRTLSDWTAVPGTSFLASPSHIWGAVLSLVPDARINETAGAYLFPGVLPIALAVAAFAWPDSTSRRHATTRSEAAVDGGPWSTQPRFAYLVLVLGALWLAAGPPIGIWPLVYWLPGMNFIRAPNRFTLLAILGLAVLAGAGFDRVASSLRRRASLAAVLGGLMIVEFAAVPLGTEPYAVVIPAIDRWVGRLARAEGPLTVAEVPLPDSRDLNRRERRQTLFMLHATAHWQKTVHGYSGTRPPQHDALYRAMLRFPDNDSLARLQALGVTHVVVHSELYAPDEWPEVNARLAAFGSRLQFLHEEAGGRVYALAAGGR
ncbi:MAG: hypothetical protein AB7N65_09730 [Vicinamibacterales bacterium]